MELQQKDKENIKSIVKPLVKDFIHNATNYIAINGLSHFFDLTRPIVHLAPSNNMSDYYFSTDVTSLGAGKLTSPIKADLVYRSSVYVTFPFTTLGFSTMEQAGRFDKMYFSWKEAMEVAYKKLKKKYTLQAYNILLMDNYGIKLIPEVQGKQFTICIYITYILAI